jgi:tetraacyldisaccharide 4'-kinase
MADRGMDRLWHSASFPARVARAALTPASWAYAAAIAARNIAYDRGWLRAHDLGVPAISIGNLTVGGTGKTPTSAFIAGLLSGRGLKPAIVMRGYGGDEALVHARLNPAIPVIANADRVRAAAEARALGRDVLVLDDAFQHRRARRRVDVVLLAAEIEDPVRLLPAGPWREPFSSLTRASLIVVTRKAATRARAQELSALAHRFAPQAARAIVHLAPGQLVSWVSGEQRDPHILRDARVLAISAIGDPASFGMQLAEFGARIESVTAPDHHPWSQADAVALARRAADHNFVVCTLKDAVKLGPVWPREALPLWYLSQATVVESGADELDRFLAMLETAGPNPTI